MSQPEKKPVRVNLLGCGDIGTAVGLSLLQNGRAPLALRRDPGRLPAGLPSRSLDYSDAESLQFLADPVDATTVFTPTPAARGVAGYRAGYLDAVQKLLAVWRGGPPRRLIYVSSTRVYGDAGGAWVDAETMPQPLDAQGEILAQAERLLLDSPHQVAVVRFSGIYGRLPSRLLERVRSGRIVTASPGRYSNRIHRDDCVGFILHLLSLTDWRPLYLASDNRPALQHEVESWLASELGVTDPVETVEPAAGNRRCRNNSMLATGYRLQYPDYRSGYRAMMASTSISAPLGNAAT